MERVNMQYRFVDYFVGDVFEIGCSCKVEALKRVYKFFDGRRREHLRSGEKCYLEVSNIATGNVLFVCKNNC